MKVKFVRMYDNIDSGRVLEVDSEKYEKIKNYVVILPEEKNKTEPAEITNEEEFKPKYKKNKIKE